MSDFTYRDLRWELQRLEELGQLVHVQRAVSPQFELSAVAKRLSAGPAVLFHTVTGYDVPVVVGTSNSVEKVAALLGIAKDQIIHKMRAAIDHPLAPVLVSHAPCQEMVYQGDEVDLLGLLPIITHYEKDQGPFITNSVVCSRDPGTGARNASYHRLHVRGPRKTGINMLPRHLWRMFQDAEALGKPLPIAVCTGLPTAIRLAAATWGATMPMDKDEFAVAGALGGQPVPMVRALTVDVDVPAFAEIVIEGVVLPGVREPEGPMMELTGHYGQMLDFPVFQVQAVTMRRGAIFQDMLTFTPEHLLMLGQPYEPVVFKAVQAVVPDVRAVHITPGGCGKFHCVVGIKKRHPGDGKDAILAAFTAVRDIKQVTVVDDDVDVFDHNDVEWAVANRFQADRDLVVITGSRGNELDLSQAVRGVTAKMGLDATKPLGSTEFDKGIIPGYEEIRLEDYVSAGEVVRK